MAGLRRRRLALGVAVLLLAVVGVLLLISAPFVQTWFVDRAFAVLQTRYDIVAHADTLDLDLASLDIRLRGLSLATRGHTDEPFFTVDEARIDLPWSAVWDEVSFQTIALVGPRLFGRSTEDGVSNLPDPSGSETGMAARRRLPIGELSITDLTVDWQDDRRGLNVQVAPTTMMLSGTGFRISGPIQLTGGIAVVAGETQLAVTGVRGELAFDGTSIELTGLRVETPEATLTTTGTIDAVLFDPSLDLTFDSTLRMAPLAERLTADAMEGTIALTGNIRGPVGEPTVTAAVSSDQLSWSDLRLEALDGQLELATGALRVDTLSLSVAGGTLSASGTYDFTGDGTSSLSTAWTDVDAGTLLSGLGVEAPFEIRSAMSGDAELAWTALDPRSVTVTAHNRGAGPGLLGEIRLDGQDGSYRLEVDQTLASTRLTGAIEARAVSPSWMGASLEGTVDLACEDLARCLKAVGTLPDEGIVAEALADLGGRLDAAFAIAGSLDAPEISGRLIGQATGVAGLNPIDLVFDLTADAARLEVGSLELQLGDNAVRGNVSLGLETGALNGRFAGSLRQLTAFAPVIPGAWTPSAGTVSLGVTLDGSLASPTLDIYELRGENVVVGPFFEGTSDVIPLNARVQLDASFALRPTVPAGGSALDLIGEGCVTTDDLAWAQTLIGGASACWRVDLGAEILSLEAEVSELVSAGTLTMSLDGSRPFEGRLRMGDDLSLLGEILDLPVEGAAPMEVAVIGEWDSLADAEVSVELAGVDARVADLGVTVPGPASFSYGPTGLSLTNVSMNVGESTVSLSGSLGPADDQSLIARVDGTARDLIALLSAVPVTDAWVDDLGATGSIALDATISGSIDSPDVSAQLRMAEAQVTFGEHPPLDQIDLRVSYQNGRAAVDRLSAMWQGATVAATGVVPVRFWAESLEAVFPEGEAQLRVEVGSLTPASLAGYLDEATIDQLEGLVNATLLVEADAPTLDALRATLTLDEADVTVSGIPLRQRRPTQVAMENRRVQVTAFDWGNDEDYLTLGGFVELGDDLREPVADLTMTGSLDLRTLGAFVLAVAAEGQANLIANIQGPWSDLGVTGTIEVIDGGLRVADPRIVVSSLNGALFLSQDTVTAHELRGRFNGGDLDIAGSLHRSGLSLDGVLTLTGRQVAMNLPEGLRTEVDAEIDITLQGGETTLDGTATIRRGDYREPMSLTGGLLSAVDRRQDVRTIGLEPTTPIDAIQLDLRVVTAEDIVLDNNYLDAALTGDIRIGGTFGAPAVTGRVALLEGGRIRVGTRTYEVETGAIDLIDPTGIDPQLDIRARTRASSYDITLSITGGQDNLTTTLQSDPPLPESDIVSLLLTGQTLSEVSASPGTGARDQALGLVSSELLGSAGRRLGLDVRVGDEGAAAGQIRFDSSLIANDVDPTTRLTVGSRLNDQLMVIFSQNLRDSGLFWVVSYLARENVEVRVLFSDTNDRGYEVRHALEFGGPPTPERDAMATDRADLRVAAVRFSGDTGYRIERLREETRLGPGDSFDFYRWQQDQDRLFRLHADAGYREARIVSRRNDGPGRDELTLDYTITRGPLTRLVFEGDELPGTVQTRLARAWELSVFDGFLMDEMRAIVDA